LFWEHDFKEGGFALAPVLGMSTDFDRHGLQTIQRSNGLMLWGRLGADFTFYAKAVDNLVSGKRLYRTRILDSKKGIVLSNDRGEDGFDFDEAEVQLGYRWRSVNIYLEKIRNIWGYGSAGSVVLSDKAPSIPQIRLAVSLGSQMKLTYVHASLYSGLLDSSASYFDSYTGFFRKSNRAKYLTAHVLEYSPWPSLNLAFGESMVYSEHLKLEYLIPLMFYRSADHQADSPDNAQMFLGCRYSHDGLGSMYGTLFIDDLNIAKIFSTDNLNIIAGTIGIRLVNVAIPFLDVVAEYTRLNPWVYTHSFESTDYTSNGYPLGHWLGQNADLVMVSLQYRWSNEFASTFSYEKYRKGELGSQVIHYTSPWAVKFLQGNVYSHQAISFVSKYEFLRNLFAVCSLTYSKSRGTPVVPVSEFSPFSAIIAVNLNLFE
jgi:hypothetical protein